MPGQAESNEPFSTIKVEQQLRRIDKEWVDALIRGDTSTLNQLMADDCIFTYTLEGDDKAEFVGDIERGELSVEVLRRENVEVRIYGRTGILMAFDTAEWRYKGRKLKGYYRTMHVYSEREGKWEIVAVQSSPITLK